MALGPPVHRWPLHGGPSKPVGLHLLMNKVPLVFGARLEPTTRLKGRKEPGLVGGPPSFLGEPPAARHGVVWTRPRAAGGVTRGGAGGWDISHSPTARNTAQSKPVRGRFFAGRLCQRSTGRFCVIFGGIFPPVIPD